MVTGRTSLRSPEYSPISSSVSEVRAISSRFHWRPATVLVTRISVVALAFDIAVDISGQILRGPADLEQHLFDPAALAGVHDNGVVIDSRAQHRRDLLVAQ